jgi:uncharacterized protein YaaW (UPF0174 family)
MTIAETLGKELVQTMSPEERKHFVDTLITEFLVRMSREEKKEMLEHILPKIIDDSLNGMTYEEKKQLIDQVITLMRSNMAHTKQ